MRLVPVLVTIAVAAVACKKSEPPPAPPLKSDVTIVDRGAEPRQLLRYALPKGTRTPVELALDLDVSAGGMGGAMPTLATTLELEVEDVLPDGRMRLHTTISGAEARDRPGAQIPAATIASQVAQLEGIAIRATLSPDGHLTDSALDTGGKPLPPALASQADSLMSSLQQFTMALPAEPVGVGAKWKSERTAEQNGMKLTTVNTVAVTALEGSKLSLETTSEIHGPDQPVTQGGITVQVSHLTGKGSGHATLDLATMALSGEFSADMSSDMAAQGEQTSMKLSMKMTMTPR